MCDIGFLLFVFIILCLPFEIYLSHSVHDTYSYKEHYMQEHRNEVRTLLLGNSYFENSLNPHFLGDSVFDLAISGRWMYYDYLLAEKYISTMSNLQFVLYPFSYAQPLRSSYHYNEWREADKDYVYNYAKSMHLLYDRFPQSIWYTSALLHGEIVKDKFLKEQYVVRDSLGYDEAKGQLENWEKVHNIDPKTFEGDLTPYMKESQFYLESIARNCFENQVELILIIPPFHDVYLQNTRQYGWDSVYSIINTTQQKYPIRLYDYHDDIEFRPDSIWYNCSHLNDIGATMLAKRIRQDAGLP